MKRNPLMDVPGIDRHPDDAKCCRDNYCRACGSHVSGYTTNVALVEQRLDAALWDWWAACDNDDCNHAYGDGGTFQSLPKWVKRKVPRQSEPTIDSP